MAQAGYTPIQLYYSTTASAAPSSGNLANGELAINITDGKLYYKDNGGTVRVLAGTGGTGVVAGSNTQLQFNNNGVFGASSSLTWNGTTLTTQNLALTGNMTSNLLFTDNTYDIGASGATRPRNLFLADTMNAANKANIYSPTYTGFNVNIGTGAAGNPAMGFANATDNPFLHMERWDGSTTFNAARISALNSNGGALGVAFGTGTSRGTQTFTTMQWFTPTGIGIGRTPQFPLDVKVDQNASTNISLTNADTGNAALTQYALTTNTTTAVTFLRASTHAVGAAYGLYTAAAIPFQVWTSGAVRMTVSSDGFTGLRRTPTTDTLELGPVASGYTTIAAYANGNYAAGVASTVDDGTTLWFSGARKDSVGGSSGTDRFNITRNTANAMAIYSDLYVRAPYGFAQANGPLGSGAGNARNHFVQATSGNTTPLTTGWITAAFGDTTAARVVIGQGASRAIIGSHNPNLTDWSDIYYSATDHYWTYQSGSTPIMKLFGSGQLGVGTTTNTTNGYQYGMLGVAFAGTNGGTDPYGSLQATLNLRSGGASKVSIFAMSGTYSDGNPGLSWVEAGATREYRGYASHVYTADSYGQAFWNVTQFNPSNSTYYQRFYINYDGNISLSDASRTATGYGITFPATQYASSNANCLDDYEEGTWTPVFTGGTTNPTVTYNSRSGNYVKIGKMVMCRLQMSGTITGAGSGNLNVSLPFVAANFSFNYQHCPIGYLSPSSVTVAQIGCAFNEARAAMYSTLTATDNMASTLGLYEFSINFCYIAE